MVNKNYNELVNKFFDEFDAALDKNFKTQKILIWVIIGSIVAFMGFAPLAEALNLEFLASLTLMAPIVCVVSLVVRRILKKKSKKIIREQECKFFDDVYMPIIAGELDAEVNSKSFVNLDFKKENAYVGETLAKRDVELAGFYNGCPYRITQGNEKVVDTTVVNEKTGIVITYAPKTIEDDFVCDYKIRRTTDSIIEITSPMLRNGWGGALKSVRMDNKNFKFEVSCNDTVAAYKFLTADMMEDIMELDRYSKIRSMFVSSDNMEVRTNEHFIDLNYAPSFSKNLEKNRRDYSAEVILNHASETVSRITGFLEKSPAASLTITD